MTSLGKGGAALGCFLLLVAAFSVVDDLSSRDYRGVAASAVLFAGVSFFMWTEVRRSRRRER